ncbi:hypothetical protein M0802_001660 [Mischocyttarus mexicanus]|nr:hypothetical protein M0802_001660 [Mischocyttarus mexicanus]
MALLKVLVSVALLVTITLADYPSPHQTILKNNKVLNGKKTIVDKNYYSESSDTSEKNDYRLSGTVLPENYKIFLNLDFNKFKRSNFDYEGSVDIKLEVVKETDTIEIHYADSIILKEYKLYNNESKTVQEVKIKSIDTKKGTDIKVLTLESKINKGEKYHLELKYNGTISDLAKGFYKGSYYDQEKKKRRWYVATDFEPIGARNAFPCFDEPRFKATFTIEIKHNKDYKAISNTIGNRVGPIDEFQRTLFAVTPKMSTYLVAYAVTDFTKTEENNVIVYSRPNVSNMTKHAVQFGNKVLDLMADYTGIKFNNIENIEKMQQLALPALKPSAMENWGLVTYKEKSLLYDESINKTIDQQRLASIISHELAHQWFGNLVTLEWWQYIWLNEGFATYFEYYITDKINEKWRFMDQFNVKVLHDALIYDLIKDKTRALDSDVSSEKHISQHFDTISYDKGAAIIRMFSHVLGEDTFKEGLQKYLKDNQYKAVKSDDLFNALKDVVKKNTLPDKVDLPTVLRSWTSQTGYPVIKVTKTVKDKKALVTITQEPFYLIKPTEKSDDKTWYVPLNYVQQTGNSFFNDTSVKLWLSQSSKDDKNKEEVVIKENINEEGWIIFNVQQTGYYRVNYDDELWEKIANYLLEEDFTTIHPLNRAQLIDDAFNLAHAGLLKYNITLKLVKYLHKETDYVVWKTALNGFSKMNNQLGLTELYPEFLKYLQPIVSNLFNFTSYVENEEDEYLRKLLRVDAIKWACALGSDDCQNYVKEQVHLWLDSNNNVTLSPDLKAVTLCAAARNASQDEWDYLYDRGLNRSTTSNERTEIFISLSCSSSPEILKNYLTDFTTPDYYLKSHFIEIFESVYSNNPIGIRVVLEFLVENVENLITYNEQFADKLWDYLRILAGKVTVKEDVHLLQTITSTIELDNSEVILDIADENMKWLEKNEKDIGNYLKADNVPSTTAKPTTEKPNSSSSLTFTTALITISLLLVALQ